MTHTCMIPTAFSIVVVERNLKKKQELKRQSLNKALKCFAFNFFSLFSGPCHILGLYLDLGILRKMVFEFW